MPKKVQKTLQDYLAKVKSPPHPHINLQRFLSACKHPKTPSFAIDDGRANRTNDSSRGGGGGGGGRSNRHNHNRSNNHKDDAATLADIDRFLFENFKSLYLNDGEEEAENTKRAVDEAQNELGPKLGPIMLDSPTSSDSSSNNSREIQPRPDNCIALLTVSPSPYDDFRRSMQEMVESRSKNSERVVDWDFMEELLFGYLNLNEKKWHKYILSAFVDVIAAARRDLEADPAKPRSVRTVRIGREVTKKTREVTFEFGSSN